MCNNNDDICKPQRKRTYYLSFGTLYLVWQNLGLPPCWLKWIKLLVSYSKLIFRLSLSDPPFIQQNKITNRKHQFSPRNSGRLNLWLLHNQHHYHLQPSVWTKRPHFSQVTINMCLYAKSWKPSFSFIQHILTK